ncbi:ATP-grasp domain-containing protein [Geoglobus acetivorans]|uniref:ATP-grasp domain-containing protein n=1 Tax=Geoglobus acetivorans TaxID=565033 RepID=A0ABZ3H4P2_GEOAI|nr:ATP-grasp domain-containing protein [Geoglobus acetivorans]
MEERKFLIVGSNVRNVAESARKAGFEISVLTKHVDADLKLYAKKIYRIDDESPEWVKKKALAISEELDAEIIWHSGYEILGDRRLKKIVNKRKFYSELERAGFDFPEILDDGESGILKPVTGGGGEGIRLSSRREEGHILQRYVKGIPCSASVISTGKMALAISFNKILVGDGNFGAREFRYCGNITPFKHELDERAKRLAEELAIYFELEGNIGVDFIIGDRIYVLEINPRFQGSLDAIEWACDTNLFRMHLNAKAGKLESCRPRRFAGRAVVFAEQDIKIKNSPAGNPFFADVPEKGQIYRKDDPLVSVLASGKSEHDVYRKLYERKGIYREIAC